MQVSQGSACCVPPAADAGSKEHMEYLKRQVDSMMGGPVCERITLREGSSERLQGGASPLPGASRCSVQQHRPTYAVFRVCDAQHSTSTPFHTCSYLYQELDGVVLRDGWGVGLVGHGTSSWWRPCSATPHSPPSRHSAVFQQLLILSQSLGRRLSRCSGESLTAAVACRASNCSLRHA